VRFTAVMVAILIAVASLYAYAAGDKKTNGFALQLAPSQNAVQPGVAVWKAGAPIFVLVTTINNSLRTVHYSLTNPGFDWEMDVRDESGNVVAETEEFRKMKQDRKNWLTAGRNVLVELKPHETGQDTIEVSYFYNLRSSGKYSVQVRREFPEVGKGFVQSNRLDINVEQ
jgi:hypothetical protein